MKTRIPRILTATIATVAATACSIAQEPAQRRQPNVLVILADDLGYGELGCQGNPQIPTPHIDSLAKGGIRFTNGYVAAPVCGPSRAALMTGRYNQRFGFEFNLGSAGSGLPLSETIMANRFKAAGYTTGMFGKWHLGYSPKNQPPERGFDWFYGFLPACRGYRLPPGMGKSLLPGGEKHNYMTDALAAEAAQFIEQHREQPWFVYLPFGAVHASPIGGRKLVPQDAGKYMDRFTDIQDPQRRIFAGMIAGLDEGVGTVLAKLQELQLEENTLIFFLGDNGGPTWQTTSRNDPLRGSKGDVLEGGIREPFIVQWKGHLPAGKVDDRPIISLDIQPTALAAAGIAADAALEGVNLLPYLADGNTNAPQRALCWRYGKKHAVRIGNWKLTDNGDGAKLYNLSADIGEKNDLAGTEPARVEELQTAYAAWNARNIPAKWGGEGKPGKAKKNPHASPAVQEAFQIEDDR